MKKTTFLISFLPVFLSLVALVLILCCWAPSSANAWCPRTQPPPKPSKPKEPDVPKEQAKPPDKPKDQPKEQPKEPPPPPPPPPPEKPKDDVPTQQPEKPTEPPKEQPKGPDSSANPNPFGPQNPGGTGSVASKNSVKETIRRPPMGFGFQPRIFDLTLGKTTTLLGVVEPWEVWWSRNRFQYLKFRKPLEFFKKTDDGYVKVIREYDEIGNLFLKALKDSSMYVAASAAMGLSKFNDPKTIDPLKKAFNAENRLYIENNILLALGLCGSPEGVYLLKETLKNKKDTELNRSYAAIGLGFIKDSEEVLRILKETISQPDKPEVLAVAAMSLGNLKDQSATALLGKLLNGGVSYQGDKQAEQVRCYAALGLGRMGTRDAYAELAKAVDDKDKDVKASVTIALGTTKLSDAFTPLSQLLKDRDLLVRGFAATAIGQIPDKNVFPQLSSALAVNRDAQVEGMIVLGMGLSGDKKAVPELQKILNNRSKRPLIKGAAAIALGLLKDKSSAPIIADMLDDKRVDALLAPYLITSLGMIGDEKSIATLKVIWEKISARYMTDIAYTNLAVALTMLGAGNEVVLPQLRKQMQKTELGSLRQHAFHSAGLVGNADFIKDFISAYDNENDSQVREYVINGLGFLVDTNEAPLMTKVTADNDHNVFMMIMEHLLYLPNW